MSECVEAPGVKTHDGYGLKRYKGKRYRAHRLVWALANGVDPSTLVPSNVIMHRCDNPGCINPAHLELGTLRDNIRDMHAKGRAADRRGELCPTVVLTEVQVQAIRERYTPFHKVNGGSKLAKEFGVSPMCISKIVNGHTWK